MAVTALTKRAADGIKPDLHDVFLWDREVRGFGLKVTPAGRRVYILQYRPSGGRRSVTKRVRLGEHGVLTPDAARSHAKQLLARVAQGHDPAADRAAEKGAASLREMGQGYLQEVRARRKPTTATEYARLWAKHILPSLGTRKVAKVTAAEVRRLHRSLHGTPYLANRVLALVGTFFSFAAREGARATTDNPAHGIERYPEKAHERFLTPEEFRRLGMALTRAEREGLPPAPKHRRKPRSPQTAKHTPKTAHDPHPANPYGVGAIRLLALTGCREHEVLSLRWDAVDFERGYLRFADTKTGQSHRPLGENAAALLRSLPRLGSSPYVFPGAKAGEHLQELKRLWTAARHAATLEGLRLHDLRHSFASVPASGGESLLIIRSLLGHRRIATTERYAHLGDDPVKRAADRAAGDISAWMEDRETTVTAIRKRQR